jgi:hypothetical protein
LLEKHPFWTIALADAMGAFGAWPRRYHTGSISFPSREKYFFELELYVILGGDRWGIANFDRAGTDRAIASRL